MERTLPAMWALLFCSPCLGGEKLLARVQPQAEQEAIHARLEQLPKWIASAQSHGRIGFYGQPRSAQWLVIDLGKSTGIDEVILFPARVPVDPIGDGSEGFPPELEVEISADESFAESIRIGRWEEPTGGGESLPPMLRFQLEPLGNVQGRFLRVRVFGSRSRLSGRGHYFTLGEIVVLAAGQNVALHRDVKTSGGIENPPRWQAVNLTDGYLWCLPGPGNESAEWNGFHSGIENEAHHMKAVEVILPTEITVDEVHLVPAYPGDFADTAGFGFPLRLRVVGQDAAGREEVLLDSRQERFPNPGAATVMIPVRGRKLSRVRVECDELWQRTGDYLFALAELQVWSKGTNVAFECPVTATDAVETGIWRTQALTDGNSSRWELLSWRDWLDGLQERMALEQRLLETERMLMAKREERERRLLAAGAVLAAGTFIGLVILLIVQKRRAVASREALRQRIAHDLHDELGASLSHLALESDLARRQLPGDHPVRDRLMSISDTARDTLDHMRDVIWLLAPATDSWQGFQRRVESIAERMLTGLDHGISVAGTPPTSPPSIAWTREWVLFYKEALTNARRHANASKIEVELTWESAALKLAVRDDGCGFDPEDPALASGLGLRTFQRRSASLGGTYVIEANVNRGVTVRLTAPYPQKAS